VWAKTEGRFIGRVILTAGKGPCPPPFSAFNDDLKKLGVNILWTRTGLLLLALLQMSVAPADDTVFEP
jgi:hypothetical protein